MITASAALILAALSCLVVSRGLFRAVRQPAKSNAGHPRFDYPHSSAG